MRKNQASLTAMGIAVLRAVESAKPPGERICDDPTGQVSVRKSAMKKPINRKLTGKGDPQNGSLVPLMNRKKIIRPHTLGRGDALCDFQYCRETAHQQVEVQDS